MCNDGCHLGDIEGKKYLKLFPTMVVLNSVALSVYKTGCHFCAFKPGILRQCLAGHPLSCFLCTVRKSEASESICSDPENDQRQSSEDLLNKTQVPEPPSEPAFPSDRDSYWHKWKSYNDWKRSQIKHGFRPKVNPAETSIFLFPGQGSQFVGMGKQLLSYPNVSIMYDTASDILGYDLLKVCTDGPKSKLDQTVHQQPAILVTSLAAVERLRAEQPWAIECCVGAAGFSIGEYAALVFAGSMSFEDAVAVVKVRAEAMQKASETVPSGMMSVFLTADARVKFACHTARQYCQQKLGIEHPVCEIANYLFPEAKVLAGHSQALSFIEKNAKEFGIRRLKYLPVSGAFHTKLMYSAKHSVKEALKNVEITAPIIPVYSNVNTYKYVQPQVISRLLSEQMFQPVKWEQSMHVLYSRPHGEEFPETFEVGPGKQLGTLLKQTNAKAHAKYHKVDV